MNEKIFKYGKGKIVPVRNVRYHPRSGSGLDIPKRVKIYVFCLPISRLTLYDTAVSSGGVTLKVNIGKKCTILLGIRKQDFEG